jgi:hypothetical protein
MFLECQDMKGSGCHVRAILDQALRERGRAQVKCQKAVLVTNNISSDRRFCAGKRTVPVACREAANFASVFLDECLNSEMFFSLNTSGVDLWNGRQLTRQRLALSRLQKIRSAKSSDFAEHETCISVDLHEPARCIISQNRQNDQIIRQLQDTLAG